ncbi:MAG: ABC transporter substrate-binding protein [Thermodesulfobacteriota bacterium]
MMFKLTMRQLLTRSFVVIFWVALIFGILYWPSTLVFREKKSINVFAWGDILEPSVVAEFEKTTGIKVNLNFYASNEEMIVKLKATGGEGYDLIIPSDYSVEILAKEGLLKQLNKSKLDFYHNLNPRLLNQAYDPGNQFSIPFEWELFILGIDKEYFKGRKIDPSWKMLFDTQAIDYTITMCNDPIQTLALASFYLHGIIDELSPKQLREVTDLLIAQKQFVNAYADFRADYFLATKNSAVVVSSSSYIWRTIRKFPFVTYLIPKEGTFMTIENLCIPVASKNEELTYKLINFLYTRDSMKTHFDTYGIFPSTIDVLPDLEIDDRTRSLIAMTLPELSQLHFVHVLTSQENVLNAWVQVKTRGVN